MIKVEIRNLEIVKANIAGMGRQLAYAASRALNATARKVADAMPAEIEQSIDRPTPFTKRGVRVLRWSNKGNLQAVVGFMDAQARYMRYQIEGGTRQAGARGIKLDEFRPDLIVLDDIDDRHDTLATVQKKIETITQSILPSGSADYAVLFVQNTIHADSVMAQLIDGRAPFLLDRAPIVVEPAVQGLEYEQRAQDDGRRTYVITAGVPTWAGQSLEVCQGQINDWGLTAFSREAQHEVEHVTGSMFSHLDFESIRVDRAAVPAIVRYAVWCDPAVTSTDQSDCNGVQVDGLGVDGRVYRFFSWEQRATPQQTIELAFLKAVEYGALTVGVETDQGGDTWYSVAQLAWQNLVTAGKVPAAARQPRFLGARAGSVGSKAERGSQMLTAYERDTVRHVRGTHTVLEKALNRFLIKKPYDLTDAAYWAWDDLANGGSAGV